MVWAPEEVSEIEKPKGIGWLLLGIRLFAIAALMFGFLVPVLVLRFLRFDTAAQNIVSFVCRLVCRVIRLEVVQFGTPLKAAGFIAANHVSWLDIFVANSRVPIYFVAKSEVRTWPMIGIFARGTGTIFIDRKAREAGRQRDMLKSHLALGHRLLFFPEGTSTDGQRVLPFKSTLFAAAIEQEAEVQALSMRYHAPTGKRVDFYGWYAEMGFMESFFEILATAQNGAVELRFHPPISTNKSSDRKRLAKEMEEVIRSDLAV